MTVPPEIVNSSLEVPVTLAQIDPGFFSVIGRGVGAILLYAIVGVLMMLLGFWAVDVTTPGSDPTNHGPIA